MGDLDVSVEGRNSICESNCTENARLLDSKQVGAVLSSALIGSAVHICMYTNIDIDIMYDQIELVFASSRLGIS